MPLIPEQYKMVRKNTEQFEDEQYYLSSKLQSEYFISRFKDRVDRWYADPELVKQSFQGYKNYSGKMTIKLKPKLNIFDKLNFENIILERKSSRGFDGTSISFSQLSNLLLMSYGLKKNGKWIKHFKFDNLMPKRSLPSGGALYTLEFYILALNIRGLSKGLYHYSPHKNGLSLLRSDKKIFKLDDFWYQKHLFASPSAIIYVSSTFDRCRIKYGSRALRYILMEAGGVGMQMNLLSTVMNIGFCFDGGGCEEKIESILGIDGLREGLITSFVIGNSA